MSTDREEVLSKVIAALKKSTQLRPNLEITESTNLADNLEIDSIDLYGFGNEIEGVFGFQLTNSEVDSFGRMTIGGIVDFLMTKLGQTV